VGCSTRALRRRAYDRVNDPASRVTVDDAMSERS